MNDTEQRLQNIAIKDWAEFLVLLGHKSLIKAKVTMLRKDGKSWAQIATKLNITVSQARKACQKEASIIQLSEAGNAINQ